MKIVRKIIRRVFAALGYVPQRSNSAPTPFRFENFENLTVAFELCRNDSGNRILPNKLRPM